MTKNTHNHRRYIGRLRESRARLRLVTPLAAAIISAATKGKVAENQDSMAEIIERATEIWNLSQIAQSSIDF